MASHGASLAIEISTSVIGAAAVVGFAKDIVGAASDAEQAMGGVDAVFKGNASAIKSWSDQSAKALGLSKTDYATLATTIGSQLKNAGTSMDQLAPKTNDLITLGADLAAQYGGSTTDAVEALSAVFKGETDPIEKYGVSIKQADIQAQKAAMGMAGLTGEADKQATAQATLALLTKQTTDAVGANAREADTAAGKQARLTASWDDASAKMGAALLPAFSSLMDAASKLVPKITPLVSAVGDLVSVAAGLPAPLLAAGAALAVFLKYSPGMKSALNGMRDGSIGAGAGFKSMGASIAKGGAIAAVVAVVGTIADSFADIGRQADAQKARVSDLAATIVDAGGKWSKASADFVKTQAEASPGFKALQAAGVSYADAMDLLTGKLDGTAKGQELFNNAIKNSKTDKERIAIAAAVAGQQDLISSSKSLAAERLAYASTETKAAAATQSSAIASQQAAEAAKKHAEALAKYRESAAAAATAQSDLLQSQLEAAAAGTALQTALDAAAGSADQTSRAVSGLNIVLDKLSGHSRTADQTAADLNQSFIDLKDTAAAAAKSGDLNTRALADWNVKALTANQTGQDVFDKLNKVRDAYTASTASAYTSAAATKGVAGANTAARDAAQSAYTQFLKTATGLGLSDAQARKLAESLGIVEGKKLTDKQLSIIAKDKEAKAALAAFEKKKLADKTAKIKAEADTAQAQADLDRVAAGVYTATVTLKYKAGAPNAIGGFNGPNTGPRMVLPGDPSAPMPAAFTAGPGAWSSPASGGAAATVQVSPTIVIQGAVDPDRTARQIKGILGGRDRRVGGIRVGGLAATT